MAQKGELWIDVGARGVDFVPVDTVVMATNKTEALRKAKRTVTTSARARWNYDTVLCVAIKEAA